MKKLLLSLVCVLGLLGGLRAQEAETISIGSGDASTKYSPTYTDATYSVAQQIFVAEEMQEKSGKITNFAFMLKPREGQPTYGVGITRKFKIYMVILIKHHLKAHQTGLLLQNKIWFLTAVLHLLLQTNGLL